MFGLFQSDLPIGKRLWLLLLALVIAGTISTSPLAKFNDPLLFTIDILLLYGLGYLCECVLSSIISFCTGYIVVKRDINNFGKEEPFYKKTRLSTHWTSDLSVIVSPILFVLVLVLITPYFGEKSRRFGAFGLFLYLLAELQASIQSATHKDHHEFLLLESPAGIEIYATTSDSKHIDFFSFKADWMRTLAFLAENGWELVEHSQEVGLGELSNRFSRTALLSRKRRLNVGQRLSLKIDRYFRAKAEERLSTYLPKGDVIK